MGGTAPFFSSGTSCVTLIDEHHCGEHLSHSRTVRTGAIVRLWFDGAFSGKATGVGDRGICRHRERPRRARGLSLGSVEISRRCRGRESGLVTLTS